MRSPSEPAELPSSAVGCTVVISPLSRDASQRYSSRFRDPHSASDIYNEVNDILH